MLTHHFSFVVLPFLSSPAMAACQSSTCPGTPSLTASPVPFSAPPTPSYTPCCTPRRLSLSLAESSTNLRDSTKTTSTSLGLVRLLLENGISASVYNPRSWDRGLDASAVLGGVQAQRCTERPEQGGVKHLGKRPDTLLLLQPSSPPSSPHSKSASSIATGPMFQFSPSDDDPPFYDTFLASKPARTILREVLGEAEREKEGQVDDDNQTEMINLRLVDKLKSFRTLSPHSASASSGSTLLGPFGSAGLGNSALGGGLPGLRRNRSYPAMVGASMVMKDPGGPPSTEILIPHTMQTSHTQQLTAHTQETGKVQTKKKTLVTKGVHVPQTLNALEMVTSQTIIQRHTRPKGEVGDSTTHDQHNDEETGT